MLSSVRKPFNDISNSVTKPNPKTTRYPNTGYEEDSSLEFKRFERIHFAPTRDIYQQYHSDSDDMVEYLNSLSLSQKSILSELDEQDSLDLLPNKFNIPINNTKEKLIVNSNEIKKKTASKPNHRLQSESYSPVKVNNVLMHGTSTSRNLKSKYEKGTTKYTTLPSSKENRNRKKANSSDDKESNSFNASDLVLLKARFESLRTKYDTLQIESQDKISLLQRSQENAKLEYEQRLKQEEISFNKKIFDLEDDFMKEKNSISKCFENEKVNFEQKISAIELSNSNISNLLEKEKQEKNELEKEIENLKVIILELEQQREKILKSEVSRLEPTKRSSSGIKSQESINVLLAQIKALEEALSAERSLAAAKLTTFHQQIQEEHENAVSFLEQKIKEEMHFKWKHRLSQIKESWSTKKVSLINRVTTAFENK